MKKNACILSFLLVICFLQGNYTSEAQNLNNITYNLFTGYGYVARTNDFMRGYNVDNADINSVGYFAFEINLEPDGSKQWHHYYKNIHYGAGLFHGIFNYSKNIGNPWGLYGFLGFSPVQTKHWQFRTDVALGISGIWDGYSSENYYNIAVSTPIEAYIHGRLNLLYNINENWHVGLSGAFIHFSNGCIKRPNKGINIITPGVNVAYNPKKITTPTCQESIPFEKNFQRLITLYDAVKGTYVDYTKTLNHFTNDTIRDTVRDVYYVIGLQYREMYALSALHNIGWGCDLTYNNAINRTKGWHYRDPEYNQGFDPERFTISAFACYEYNIHRLSFVVEPIVYLYKPHNTYFTRLAQRIGLRYQIHKGWYYQLTLRAYQFTKADYIEGGIGYRFKY